MLNEFSRTELLIGKEAMQRLYGARVAVFGIGGVGGAARQGAGAVLDADTPEIAAHAAGGADGHRPRGGADAADDAAAAG